ncbi:MAG: hypothetical protein JXR68_04520 [Bacteroidales bacterium]|nr:hypothetical protein [Bacteroidales bacterium]
MKINPNLLSKINLLAKGEFDPFYIYESQKIRQNCRVFHDIPYKNKAIHFATMANINNEFLKIVNEEKINVFVNSLIHMEAVQKAGFTDEQIIFTSSALSEKTMRKIHSAGAQLNLDSPRQFDIWQKLYSDQKVGIRCNIGDKVEPYSTRAGFFIGKQSRLGFTVDELKNMDNKHIIKGLHLYAGTDIFDLEYFLACYNELIELSFLFPNIEYLNFGGGFGVSEDGETNFDVYTYGLKVSELMQKASEMHKKNLKLILEPGRIIGGIAGHFVAYITDIKKRDNQILAGLNASTTQFSRPLLYPDTANHPALIIRNEEILNSDKKYLTTIFGSSTYSRDIFCANRNLPELKIGDVVVFGNGGSYSASSYTEFLGFMKPQEIFF